LASARLAWQQQSKPNTQSAIMTLLLVSVTVRRENLAGIRKFFLNSSIGVKRVSSGKLVLSASIRQFLRANHHPFG
jgi:hypothetical protein